MLHEQSRQIMCERGATKGTCPHSVGPSSANSGILHSLDPTYDKVTLSRFWNSSRGWFAVTKQFQGVFIIIRLAIVQ